MLRLLYWVALRTLFLLSLGIFLHIDQLLRESQLHVHGLVLANDGDIFFFEQVFQHVLVFAQIDDELVVVVDFVQQDVLDRLGMPSAELGLLLDLLEILLHLILVHEELVVVYLIFLFLQHVHLQVAYVLSHQQHAGLLQRDQSDHDLVRVLESLDVDLVRYCNYVLTLFFQLLLRLDKLLFISHDLPDLVCLEAPLLGPLLLHLNGQLRDFLGVVLVELFSVEVGLHVLPQICEEIVLLVLTLDDCPQVLYFSL